MKTPVNQAGKLTEKIMQIIEQCFDGVATLSTGYYNRTYSQVYEAIQDSLYSLPSEGEIFVFLGVRKKNKHFHSKELIKAKNDTEAIARFQKKYPQYTWLQMWSLEEYLQVL